MGGRQGMLEAALASSNPKAQSLAELLGDKAHKDSGTMILAKKAGLSLAEAAEMFCDKQWLLTRMSLHENLPEIVADAAVDAKASFQPCEECKGAVSSPPCYVCGGSGKVRKPGDDKKLRFIGEAVGLVGKPDQTNVNTQVNVAMTSHGQSFEDLMRAASVTTVQKRAIEGIKEPNGKNR